MGIGLALFALTFGELGTVRPPSGAITALALTGLGGLTLLLASRRYRSIDRANRRFFEEFAGTEILAVRRRLQERLAKARTACLIAVVAVGAWWIVLASTYSCAGDVCTGFMPHHAGWFESMRALCVALGIVTLALASLVRVYGAETDRWEDVATEALRRRDDGPVPGLKRSRWE